MPKLMPVTLLAMWGSLYWLWTAGMIGLPLAVALITTHLISTVVFYHFVYVFNYGYAWTMIALPLWFGGFYLPGLPALAVVTVAGLYGVRLLSFTWDRYHSESYAPKAARARESTRAIPFPVIVITWFFMGSLLFFIGFNLWIISSGDQHAATIWPAIALMILGLLLEAAADRQKQKFKHFSPNSICMTGLYRSIRHPNYLGEIIFHIGLYGSLVSTTTESYALILGGFGSAWLLILMCDEARMSDRRQLQQYGESPAYIEYRKNTGALLPKLF
jgi:steroid 5-alpha reductase family enzyme